uniref:Uncharacterized protein n=1 Tax=Marseillevirus LCMAC201 TaxID=2506605 RepID=A0A481YV50_9VIRU|nr:MAG: hypothetical protein LCMAC201_00650 [Marseillevirus LCMAC201]
MKIPWKEALLLMLLVGVSVSLSDLKLKPKYNQMITRYPSIRFLIIFITAFLLFTLDIGGQYSITTRLLVSVVVAYIIQAFIARSTMLTLLPPSEEK